MNYGNITRPKKTLRGMELDMRGSTALGIELRDEIYASVEHTQKFIVTELPDWLIVTQKQFASLNDYTEAMYQTTDRMMRTPWNVMEVQIDREFDTMPEIEQAIKAVEEMEITDYEQSNQDRKH